MMVPSHWHKHATMLLGLIGILAVAASGAFISHLVGPPKAFLLIVLGMAVWAIAGWSIGGWRPALAGLAALTAALTASNGSYPFALLLSCLAFLLLFTNISPREAPPHSKASL
jgi:hypothetical protein